jgi:hypothetical protein
VVRSRLCAQCCVSEGCDGLLGHFGSDVVGAESGDVEVDLPEQVVAQAFSSAMAGVSCLALCVIHHLPLGFSHQR